MLMEKFLEKKIIKVVCIYINPVVIGILFSFVFTFWTNRTLKTNILFAIGILLLLIYAYTCYKYGQMDKNEKSEKNKLREKNEKLEELNIDLSKDAKSFDKGMRELATLFYDSSDSLNKTSAHLLEGNWKLELWNFKKVATGICSSVYGLLCEVCKPYDDFTVNIMLADPTATGKKRNITMIAHKGKYEKYPEKFEEKLYFDKYSAFYAVKVCKSNKKDIRVLTTREEVNEKFVYIDEEHPEYSQYIGIPIVCSKNKIVCLLQICSFGNDKIAESKADIMKIVMRYLYPFTQYALLAYKIEKSLISSFSAIDNKKKKGESNNATE